MHLIDEYDSSVFNYVSDLAGLCRETKSQYNTKHTRQWYNGKSIFSAKILIFSDDMNINENT